MRLAKGMSQEGVEGAIVEEEEVGRGRTQMGQVPWLLGLGDAACKRVERFPPFTQMVQVPWL